MAELEERRLTRYEAKRTASNRVRGERKWEIYVPPGTKRINLKAKSYLNAKTLEQDQNPWAWFSK